MKTFIAIMLCLAILPSGAYAKQGDSDKIMLDAIAGIEFANRASAMCLDFKSPIDLEAGELFINHMENVIGHKQVSAKIKKVDSLVSKLNTIGGRDAFCAFAKHVQEESTD